MFINNFTYFHCRRTFVSSPKNTINVYIELLICLNVNIISYIIIHQKDVLLTVCVYLCLKDAVPKCCPLSGVILLFNHAVGRPIIFLFRLHIFSFISLALFISHRFTITNSISTYILMSFFDYCMSYIHTHKIKQTYKQQLCQFLYRPLYSNYSVHMTE